MRHVCLAVALLAPMWAVTAGDRGGRVEYVGGTVAEMEDGPKGRLVTVNERYLVYESRRVHYLGAIH